ncbi:DUF2383 domain-containing protein [Marivita hallyeonensis]|uniref:DUF2383 domain-containing protein n=1 Tax=Marivita hallyeonensis TaxID=996342 RepID=A0A1M5QK42_9RHOB|nr:DUF2383 domain-containing protein [Marivita hallyeonensis]SHH14201.1 protein of unknown function [Marivita hallyeonensis]
MTHSVNPPITAGREPDLADEDARTPNDHLQELYTRIVDAKAGFDVMVDKAEPDFRDVALSFRDMHQRHADTIKDMLHGNVEEDGSFMGTINKAVVSMRAFFDEIDEDVMDQVRRGEEHVIDAFRTAEASVSQADEARLIALRAELEDLLDRTKHLD